MTSLWGGPSPLADSLWSFYHERRVADILGLRIVPAPSLVEQVGEFALKLAKAKLYPREAYTRREQGTATVRVAMSRSGQVLRATLVKSSGSEALDEESLALVRRAQPLPALPPGLPDPLEITVPVRFSMR
jgi:periplasmic protein TonB